jgi:4-cresol dehydrogenase (hydroxylating) flavoprotein subunit
LRWGVGPSIDGLFSQSNLGIVTEVGIWLAPVQPHLEAFFFTVSDEAMPSLLDRLRPFRMRGTLPTSARCYQLLSEGRISWWGFGGLHAETKEILAAERGVLATAFEGARFTSIGSEKFNDRNAWNQVATEISLPPARVSEVLRHAGLALVGTPIDLPAHLLLAFFGGQQVQQLEKTPTSNDPLVNDYGSYFIWPVCPARSEDIKILLGIVRKEVAAAPGVALGMTLQLLNGRVLVAAMRLNYDRKQKEIAVAAEACYHSVLQKCLDAGYPPYRVGNAGMAHLKEHPSGFDSALARIKSSLDPQGILAPGRYL